MNANNVASALALQVIKGDMKEFILEKSPINAKQSGKCFSQAKVLRTHERVHAGYLRTHQIHHTGEKRTLKYFCNRKSVSKHEKAQESSASTNEYDMAPALGKTIARTSV